MEILGGPLFSVAGAGESHGPGITTLVFGCPPGLQLSRSQIQAFLDRRRPGSNRHGTPRNEKDKVLLLAGLYQDNHNTLSSGPTIETIVQVIKRRVPAGLEIKRRIAQGNSQQVDNLIATTLNGSGVINTAFIERLNATFQSRMA